jgi:3-deoxy-D-manno-octulosonate 8-phosphate phosphatase (KDO 8-P phosphatase)
VIELLVLDVDGCLSDGSITYSASGDEIKTFNVKDGLAIASWRKIGKKSAIITGRDSKIVARRAEELGVAYLYQGIKDKRGVLEKILKEENLTFENVAAIGDDLNDFTMLQSVGWSFTPANGSRFIKEIVDTVLTLNGGKGAVREMIEEILQKENKIEEFLRLWQ